MSGETQVYARAVEVAGAYFRYKDCLDFINTDGPKGLSLELEPTNKYDPNAIRVKWGHRHLGYVPAPLAKAIYMDNIEDRIQAQPVDSYIDDSGKGNPKLRIVFNILVAELREEVLK